MTRATPPPWLLLALASCATQGGVSNGGVNLPSSGVGPFRPLVDGELVPQAVTPYVLGDSQAQYREPDVVGTSDDPTSAAVWMYAVATVKGAAVVVRTRADDARSFYGDAADNADTTHPRHEPPTVLAASDPWEGTDLGGPCAVRSGGQVLLYYGAAGGIGVAASPDGDGLTFTKHGAPVLAAGGGGGWETSAPRAPSVAVFPDGTWHMLYAAGDSIGEATSADGIAWTRVGADPVLGPSAPVDPSTLGPGEQPPFDEGGVDDPVIAPQTNVDGRLQVRVLYTGYRDAAGSMGSAPRRSAIGLAGRFGDAGALTKQAAPVFTVQLHERAPGFFEYAGGSLLYVGEDDTSQSTTQPFQGIGAAYAPVGGRLPAPLPFPATP